MFKIGDFSRLSGVSIRMLRYYDKMELLTPDQTDTFSGFRYYSAKQLERVNKIQKLKSLGFSLAIIKEILEKGDAVHLEQYFDIRKKELEEEMMKLSIQQKQIDSVKDIIVTHEDIMKYNVVLKHFPEQDVMSIRRVIPSYNNENELWQELYQEYEYQKVKSSNPPFGRAVYHDEEHKDEDITVEVQSGITGNYKDTDHVKFYKTQAVQAASITFHGSYDQMPSVAEAAAKWIEDNNYRMDGPMFHIFHVSPAADPNPQNWVTEACYQIIENN